MNPTEILAQNYLTSRINEAAKQMQELKQSQFIGTDSILFYQEDTGNAYDWSGILPDSPQAPYVGTKILKVKAKAQTQNVLFADLIFELYINNMLVKHTVVDYITELSTFGIYFNIYAYLDPVPPSETDTVTWTVVIDGGDGMGIAKPTNTCFAKFYVVANDQVDITIIEVN